MTTVNKMYIRSLLTAAVVLSTMAVTPHAAQAQSDVQLWTDAGIRYRVTRRLRLEASFLMRFDQDLSRGRLFGPAVGASYKIAKWIRVGAGYRYEYRRIGGSLRNAHRLNLDLSLRHKLGPVRLGYRLRFQERFRDRASGNSDVRGIWRNRIGVHIDTDTLFTPYASLEFFTGLHGRRADPLNKLRFTMGAALDLGRVDLSAYYRVQVPINRGRQPTVHILGVSARVDFRGPRSRRREHAAPIEAADASDD